MNLFDFTEEDLKSNQRGSVSPRQREWLNMTAGGIHGFSWKNALIAVCFIFLGLCIILVPEVNKIAQSFGIINLHQLSR